MKSVLLGNLAGRVRELRRERGWTAQEVAGEAGLSLRFYHSLESGAANISVTRLASVARALGVDIPELFQFGKKKIVALLGLRGAGKSTIGPKLAKRLKCFYVELDDRIERSANLKLTEIFSMHGEAYYRRIEWECLRELISENVTCVVALPGGIVRNDEAFSEIQRSCTTIWLRARPDDHMKRVYRQGDRRPMANREDAMEELKNILRERDPLYQQSEVTIDTSSQSVSESVKQICGKLKRVGW